jgi:hypothetical protein
MNERINRPLERIYAGVFIHAIVRTKSATGSQLWEIRLT